MGQHIFKKIVVKISPNRGCDDIIAVKSIIPTETRSELQFHEGSLQFGAFMQPQILYTVCQVYAAY